MNLVDTRQETDVHNVDKYLNDIAFAAVEALLSQENSQVRKECIELVTLQCERLRQLTRTPNLPGHISRAHALVFA